MAKRKAYDGYLVKLRPVAYQRLCDMQEELTRQTGRAWGKAQIVEAALNILDRVHSMEHENDFAAFHGKNEGE